MRRRRAIYTPIVDRPLLDLKAGIHAICTVWGCFQVTDGEDVNPYFVIELNNGMCTYAAPEQIQFIKEAD